MSERHVRHCSAVDQSLPSKYCRSCFMAFQVPSHPSFIAHNEQRPCTTGLAMQAHAHMHVAVKAGDLIAGACAGCIAVALSSTLLTLPFTRNVKCIAFQEEGSGAAGWLQGMCAAPVGLCNALYSGCIAGRCCKGACMQLCFLAA